MSKIISLEELRKMKESVKSSINLREYCDNPESVVQVIVAMSECGISAGAKQIFDFFFNEFNARNIKGIVTQQACIGNCSEEPVIEVILPGKESVFFKNVTSEKAAEILEKYIIKGEMI